MINPHPRPLREDDFSLAELWRVLQRRRLTIALVAGGCFLLAVVVSLLMPRKYSAEALLEIGAENTSGLDLPTQPEPASPAEYAVDIETQCRVLQNDALALEVIHRLDLAHRDTPDRALALRAPSSSEAEALRRFHKQLSVKVEGGTRLVRVRYQDADPSLASTVVNTLIDDYLERYFQTRYMATRQASDWLDQQLAELKSEVEASQQRLVDYQKQTGILGESETNNIVMSKLEELNRQLSAAQANRIVKQAVWQLVQTGDPEVISSVAGASFTPGAGTSTNPAQLGLLPALRAQEAQLKAEIAQNSARLGPAFPKLLQMNSQLAELQRSIQTEIGKVAARAENDYRAAKSAEDLERSLFEHQKREANRLNDTAIQYGVLKREAEADRALYDSLLGKLKQASVLAGLHSSRIMVVDPARPATTPSSPKYLLNLLLGFGAGIVMGIATALLQDSLDRSVQSPEQVERATGMRVLGVIPEFAKKEDIDLQIGDPFRAIRTSLSLSRCAAPPKTLLVTSALPQEGKTTVSTNLARILAQQGAQVLLVDADFRRASVHVQFDKPWNEEGLSSLLSSSTINHSQAIQHVGNGLHLLLAGSRPALPTEMLGSSQMEKLLHNWREHFDYVVLDTPPALLFSDALLLSQHVDAVLITVRAASTTQDALKRTRELFVQSQRASVDIVLNRLSFHSPDYPHYFGYRPKSKLVREYPQ